MKKILMILAIMVGSIVAINAQNHPQTANEGYIGYSFLRQDVQLDEAPELHFNRSTDSHGAVVRYTRYLGGDEVKAGVVGLTGEVGANFRNDQASLVTAMGGVTLKARNLNYVQPSIKVLGGVARQNVSRLNLTDNSDISSAFSAGVGLDFQDKKYARYKLHVGADYINTGFHGERQHGVRLTTGLVF